MTKGKIAYDNGFNLKDEILKEIEKRNFKVLPKLIFHIESPYQKRRYRSEYIGQEVWVNFKKSSPASTLITQEDWENLEYREVVVADLMHSIEMIN